MMFFIVLGVLVFRWPLFERFLGTKRMHFADAIIFTVLSAMNFATKDVGGWMWFSYAVGALCIYWAYKAGKTYLQFDEVNNGQKGKSDDESASGS